MSDIHCPLALDPVPVLSLLRVDPMPKGQRYDPKAEAQALIEELKGLEGAAEIFRGDRRVDF